MIAYVALPSAKVARYNIATTIKRRVLCKIDPLDATSRLLGDRLSVDLLIKILSEEFDPDYRPGVTQLLISIQDEHVLETVIETVSTRHWYPRAVAAHLLGLLGSDEPVHLLLTTLRKGCKNGSFKYFVKS